MNLLRLKNFYRLLVLLIAVMSASLSTKAQGIYQNWGTTRDGGPDNVGGIFSSDSGGGRLTGKHFFTLTNKGGMPQGAMVSYGGKLYGVAQTGGAGNKALIYSYDPGTGPGTDVYTKEVDITGVGTYSQASDLTLYNGLLYGTTTGDNLSDFGVLYSYDPATSTFTPLHTFDDATTGGNGPIGALVEHNNVLYGVTTNGGVNDYGTIFSFDPAGSGGAGTYTKLIDIGSVGNTPTGSLVFYNNKFYGNTSQVATGDGGTVFEYDIATNAFTWDLQLSLADAQGPDNGRLLLYNNNLYGLSSSGGLSTTGVLFKIDPTLHTYDTLHSFINDDEGVVPRGGLFLSNTSTFLGLTYAGGNTTNSGVLFEFDPATNAYTKKIELDGTDGAHSSTTLIIQGGLLYGVTEEGGSSNKGVIFRYDPTDPGPGAYAKKKDFGTSIAATPSSSLTYYNKLLYGTTQKGGDYGLGTIYQYDKASGTTTVLYSFDGTNGSYPMGDLLLQGGKFYAMTMGGGASENGVLFSYDPAANSYINLHDFSTTTSGGGGNADIGSAQYISNPLLYYNGKIFGTTHVGGTNTTGVIFSYDPVGGTYSPLYNFGPDGGEPTGGLTELNGKLYGLAISAGTDNQGSIFEIDPSGSGYADVHSFSAPELLASNVDVLSPPGLTVVNGKLYGVAWNEGANQDGYLFEYTPGGSFNKFDFNNSSSTPGSAPVSKLMERNGFLYGMAYAGGASTDYGTIYKFDPASGTFSPGSDFNTSTSGAHPTGTTLVSVPAPVADGGNCVPIASSNVNSTGWKGIIDASGAAIAEVNPNGNSLTSLAANLYVQSSPERQYKGYSFLNRSITITVGTQPSSAVDLRLYVKKSEVDDLIASPTSGVTSPNDIAIFKSEDPCNNGAIGSDLVKLTTSWTTWEDDYVFTTQVSSFSTFHLASVSVALPITLLDFTANRKTKNEVLLNWSTSTEINSDYFNIERSEDALHFTTAGKVAAAGTSSLKRSYLFTDMYSSNNDVYYRLKMVDKDGSYKYSKTVKVSGAATTVSISPNPAHNTITITGARFTQLQIIDATGQLVKQFGQLSSNQYDISNLQQGMYTLRFINGTTVTSSKFIKL